MKRVALAMLLGLTLALGAVAASTTTQQPVRIANPGGGHGGTGG
jgi:Spy/CpxP family protein refolding chaperone